MADEKDIMIEVDTIFIPMEETGEEEEFAIMDYFDHEGKQYIIVSKVVDDMIEDDTVMYGYSEDGDDLIIEYIEDDEEYDKLVEAYQAFVSQLDETEE